MLTAEHPYFHTGGIDNTKKLCIIRNRFSACEESGMKAKIILFIFLSACSLQAYGGDTTRRIVVNLASVHIGAPGEWYQGRYSLYNERNLGLGMEYDFFKGLTLMGGFYRDSYNTTALYVGGMWRHWLHKNFALGLEGGLVQSEGYRRFARLLPLGGLVATVQGKTFGVNIGVIPMGIVSPDVNAVLTFQLTAKIK